MNLKGWKSPNAHSPSAAEGFVQLKLKLFTEGIFRGDGKKAASLQKKLGELESWIKKFDNAIYAIIRDGTPLGQGHYSIVNGVKIEKKLRLVCNVKSGKKEERLLNQKEFHAIVAKLGKQKAKLELAAGFACVRLGRLEKDDSFSLSDRAAKHFKNADKPFMAARMLERSIEHLKQKGYMIDHIDGGKHLEINLTGYAKNSAKQAAELYAEGRMHADSARMHEKAAELEGMEEAPKALEIAWCLKNAGKQHGLAGNGKKELELENMSGAMYDSPKALVEKAWNCVRGGGEYYPEANIHLNNALLRNPGEKLKKEIKTIKELMNWQATDDTIAILNQQDLQLN